MQSAAETLPGPHLAALGKFRLSGPAPKESPQRLASQWRGAVAARFQDEPEFHGHDGDRVLYRYPRVQYRWLEGAPALFAIGASAEQAMNHPWPGTSVQLGGSTHAIVDVAWQPLTLSLSHSDRLLRYEFGAPWLALNQDNSERYALLDPAGQRAELDRILVSNLLSAFKGLGWTLPAGMTVYAAAESPRPVRCQVKGVSLRGFLGSFVTNFALPAGLALGRSVSHGFGWIGFIPRA